MCNAETETMQYSSVTNQHHSCVEDFKWCQKSVMVLISQYQKKKAEFLSGFVKKRDLWAQVASEMSVQGFIVSFIACEKKWHNLCATYRKLKESSIKKRSYWPYFQPLREILETNIDVQNVNLNGRCHVEDESTCKMVKNSSSDGESKSCDQDISNMLSVRIEENLDGTHSSRDNLHISTSSSSSYFHAKSEDFKWTHESITLMCSLYLARKEQFFSGTVKKRDLWTDIAQEMNREGFPVVCNVCEKKWHNLIATYKKVSMYSRKKTWPYLQFFKRIIEDQALQAGSTGFSEHNHLSNDYSKDFSKNAVNSRYFDTNGSLCSSSETHLREQAVHNTKIIADDFRWTHASVISLCTLYKEKRCNFISNTVRKRDLWMDIANEMNSQGFPVTWAHCEKKWYNLYATYKKVIDHNRKRVRVWSTWPYLKLFQEIFSTADGVAQQSLVSTEQSKYDDINVHYQQRNLSSPNSDNSLEIEHLPNSCKHSTKKQSSAPEWFWDYCKQQRVGRETPRRK